MKNIKLFHRVLWFLPFVDFVLVYLSFLIAYKIRASEPHLYLMPYQEYKEVVLIFSALTVVGSFFAGVYLFKSFRKVTNFSIKILLGVSFGISFSIIFLFGNRIDFFSRKIFAYAVPLSVLLIVLARLLILLGEKILVRRGIVSEKILLVSKPDSGNLNEFLSFIESERNQSFKTVSIVFLEKALSRENVEDLKNKFGKVLENVDFLECVDGLKSQLKRSDVDTVLVLDSFPEDLMVEILHETESFGRNFKYALSPFNIRVGSRTEYNTMKGMPIASLKPTPLDGGWRIAKKAFDFFAALGGIIILSPILALIAILIKKDSKGPIFHKHDRVGYDGKHFTVWKFRTMVANAEHMKEKLLEERGEDGLFKVKNDPRVTKIGKFLRKTSLDEFPQLLNVLKGEMSLVGPRPFVPEEEKQFPFMKYKRRFVKPGMTGLWQVSGRSNLDLEELIKLDSYYVENWSMILDLQILYKTIFVVLNPEGAF